MSFTDPESSATGARKPLVWMALALFLLLPTGCVRTVLQLSDNLIPNLAQALFEECDTVLAKQSLPANLKILEGVVKSDPENRRVLTGLCAGFTGYAMLFVEDEDPSRASGLYLRARAYGVRALGKGAGRLGDPALSAEDYRKISEGLERADTEALFWTCLAWNGWIHLNLDKPDALAQLPGAEACLERILEIEPGFFYGTPYILKATLLAARPAMLSGDAARAGEFFTKAAAWGREGFLLVDYHVAKYYAVRVQDKQMFLDALDRIANTPADRLKGACLINAVVKEKAKRLKEMSEDLFI